MPEVPHQPLGEIVANWREPPFPAREVMHGRFCRLEPLDAAKHAKSLFYAYAPDPTGSCWPYLPYRPF